jgi:manganese transport protein
MEGFVRLRVRPWVRRLLTRSLAILPALLVLGLAGNLTETDRSQVAVAAVAPLGASTPLEAVAGVAAAHDTWRTDPVDRRLLQLLVLSQVLLSFQLPFAIVPLVQLTGDARRMGAFVSGPLLTALAWTCAVVVVCLNVVLIYLSMGEWGEALEKDGISPLWVYGSVGPVALALAGFLGWVTAYPYLKRREEEARALLRPPLLEPVRYHRIGVAVEFTAGDDAVLEHAANLARAHSAPLVLIHVVEGTGASLFGPDTADQEARRGQEAMAVLVDHLHKEGLQAEGLLGYGTPAQELVRLARESKLDLLVLGTHGHRFLADLALGETVSPVLHRLTIPVLVVPAARKV